MKPTKLTVNHWCCTSNGSSENMSILLDRCWYKIITPRLLIAWTLWCSACSVKLSIDGFAVEGRETRLICRPNSEGNRGETESGLWKITYIKRSLSPVTIVEIYRGKEHVYPTYHDRVSVEEDTLQFTLVIHNTNRTDDGTYQCKYGDEAGEVRLTVMYLDLPTLRTRDFNVNEDDTVIFTCLLGEGNPKPSITWLKDGEELDVSNATKYPESNLSLAISKVTKSDEGKYKCRAENEVLAKESREAATLTVNSLIPLSTPARRGSVPSSISTPAALECKASAGPVTSLVVGMIFVGIFIGTVLSLSVSIILWKLKTSSKATQGTMKENQEETYTEYGGELKTGNQVYQDLRKKDDQVYVNINEKKGKRKY